MNYFVFAWRNIWRNKRRTIITVAAIVVAVFISTFVTSMQEGTYSKMIDNVVKFYSGYLQIQNKEYKEYKTINESFDYEIGKFKFLDSLKNVIGYTQRLEYFTLFSTGENTRGGPIIGIDPYKENKLTNISFWVKEGEYLEENDNGILLGENIVKSLKAKIGDTIILISQGYHGASAAGLFYLKGIIKYPNPQLNNIAFIEINKAQEFFSADDKVTSLVIFIDNNKKLNESKNEIQKKIKNFETLAVLTWEEMQPELKQMIESDKVTNAIMKIIFYIVAGFGILGTIIMMMEERKKEFAIMMALGLKKIHLIFLLSIETIYIALIGIIFGLIVSFPVISFLTFNPVKLTGELEKAYEMFGMEPFLFFSIDFPVFAFQIITVLLIVIFIILYPAFVIAKSNIIKILKS